MRTLRPTRRDFLATSAAAAMPFGSARVAAKYTRYNVTSPEGQKALASYAKAVGIMLKLPPDDPHNWFRTAFIHLVDCPHGNWWFYVWHRGFLGYFEQTVRALSQDPSFAFPYWDWTALPEIPGGLFDGVLTPTDPVYEAFTSNLAVFTSFIKPALTNYWNSLSSDQRAQLSVRGYNSIDDLWNDVIGYSPSASAGISGNMAYAITCGARYLSRDNPKLDPKTTFDVSPLIVYSGLLPTNFNNTVGFLSFTSSKTPSHNTQPVQGATVWSVLEGFPHNKVHNCIGGVAAVDPGPYGNMTNFLSPVDPIFFLHHSNMDRLWDVWTRKQQALKLPYLPTGVDLQTLSNEPFLFYVNDKGNVGPTKAGEFFSTDRFEYDYAPGFGEDIVQPSTGALVASRPPVLGSVKGNAASVVLPHASVTANARRPAMAEVTLPRPTGFSTAREFDVLVNAPPGVTQVSADSPYYAGTIAFFGAMMPGMKMSPDATFAVPLPPTLHAFTALGAAASASLNIRVVPSHGQEGPAPVLKSLSVGTF